MTKEEREAKIKEIKEKIFNIEVGSDFLSFEQSNRLRALYVMLRELEKEVQDDI